MVLPLAAAEELGWRGFALPRMLGRFAMALAQGPDLRRARG